MYKLTGFVLFLSFLQIIPATTTKTGTSSISTTCQSTMTSLIESLQDCATALDPVTAAKKCSSCFSTCCNDSNNDILAKLNVTSSQLDTLVTSVDGNVKNIKDLLSKSSVNQNAINNLTDIIKDLLHIVTKSQPSALPSSCKEIKTKWPNSTSGYYHIGHKTESQPSYVYCHMEELCSSGGGWTRIAYLDMSDSLTNCPPGFRLYQAGSVRACGRQHSNSGSCQSVKFPSYGINYSQVCGKVVGYQHGTPDALYPGRYQLESYGSVIDTHHNNINSYYVDGISLTHGSPRQHIWTYVAGLIEASFHKDGRYNCPCSQGSLQDSTIPSFIGNDYFCESGNPSTNSNIGGSIFYTADPLWDGKGCGSLEQTCCQAPGLPWFHKVLNSTTINNIEMRVCEDQGTNDEDVTVNFYEIYIK